MKILVTGGAGFIGSALCRYLINETEHSVVNVDKLTYAATLTSLTSIEASPRYSLEVVDIAEQEAIATIFKTHKPDAVVHLAAETHVDRSITGADDFIQTNVLGTFSLLEAARSFWDSLEGEAESQFRLLHVSTDEVYGSLGDQGLFTEKTAYDPSSPYSASKAASDHLLIAWYRTYGFPGIISNCSNNYGPFQFPEKLIPLTILNAQDGRGLPIYGDGSNVRDWLFVDDHARALYTILKRGRLGEKYNVGGHNERTNLQLVHAICDIFDELRPKADGSYRDQMRFVADRPGHDTRYAIDARKLENELGWRAQETLKTGLRRTIEWYLENDQWWRPLRQDIYQGERLGLTDKKGSETL